MRSIARYRVGGFLCACALAFLTTGCATTSNSSTGEWQQPRVHKTPYQTVLVVAAMPNRDVRRAMDQTLAGAITDGGTKGVSGFALARQMEVSTLTRDLVITMAKESGADAVIVTRILGSDAQIGERRGEIAVKYNPGVVVTQNEDSSMTSVMASEYWIEVADATSVIDGGAVLESYLYEPVTGDKLIYRATSRGNFRLDGGERIEGIAQDFALLIARQLRSDGVIR